MSNLVEMKTAIADAITKYANKTGLYPADIRVGSYLKNDNHVSFHDCDLEILFQETGLEGGAE